MSTIVIPQMTMGPLACGALWSITWRTPGHTLGFFAYANGSIELEFNGVRPDVEINIHEDSDQDASSILNVGFLWLAEQLTDAEVVPCFDRRNGSAPP